MGQIVVCKSLIKPQEIPVASSKGDGTYYTVIAGTLFNDAVCDCKGFEFRGTCKHVRLMEAGKCRFFRQPNDTELETGEITDRCPNCLNELVLYELDPELD